MKNSIKMLICLKHLKVQIFLVSGFYGYTKYLKSNLNSSIYKPAQELHNKPAPKYDFNKQ